MKLNRIDLKDIHPSIINAAYYPFQTNEVNGPRKSYTPFFSISKAVKVR